MSRQKPKKAFFILGVFGMAISSLLSLASPPVKKSAQPPRPNIILIMTDDQGYGDLGFQGNPYVKTPNIDKLAVKSTRLTNYHHSPVCAPTRASLLTGRYHQRTGVHDTWNNGAIMATEEITMAELFSQNGYQTGIVGKWHLGDNYPFRPSEQGFQYSLIHHGGGGIGQPGDIIDNYIRTDSSYFNTLLFENNIQTATKGYCTDVFTDGALKFIEKNKDEPFFLYVAYNAPHSPLQVPQKYYELYKDLKFNTPFDLQADKAWSKMTDKDKEDARRVYAMVTNIDENVGRILTEVKKQSLENNTIIIFTTDNGNPQLRYNTGLKGNKGTAYEGGTKVPYFISGKGIPENKEINALLAHVDVLPTFLEAAKIPLPTEIKLDGKSAWPLIQGKISTTTERQFYNSWNRGWGEPYRNAAYYKGNYKLIAFNADENNINTFGLYHLKDDPFEQNNLVTTQKELGISMKKGLDSIFAELSASPQLSPRRIEIGSVKENPTVLNRQDWGGNAVSKWDSENALGIWTVSIQEDGYYNFKLINIKPIPKGTRALVRLGQIQRSKITDQESTTASIENIYLTKGDCNIESWFEWNGNTTGPYYLEVFKKP